VPIYDYTCESCGRTIEVVHSVHGHGPKACEVCGGRMRKLMSFPTIVFKGSGWAKNDARASSGGSRSRSGGGARPADGEAGSSTPAPAAGGEAGSGTSSSGTSTGGDAGGASTGGDAGGNARAAD